MADRAELVEAALEVYPEGLALLDTQDRVVFWNRAAETITGYSNVNLLGRPIPGSLQPLLVPSGDDPYQQRHGGMFVPGKMVHAQHQGGHDLPSVARTVVLRDGLGARIGTALVFHPAEEKHALPHGETSEGVEVKQSQAELRERLEMEFESFAQQHAPLGILWIAVDQGVDLRKTHGARASEVMLENAERTLANALRAEEGIGRWGDDEFLVLLHEPSVDKLVERANSIVGIARTVDFRWWGDRLSLTVSIGAAQAENGEALPQFLERAQAAMLESMRAGGNHVSVAPWRMECSRS